MFKKLLFAFCCLPILLTGCSSTEQKFGIVFTANIDGAQDIYRAEGLDFEKIEQLTFTPVDEEKFLHVNKTGDQLLFYVPSPSPERIMAEALTPPANYPHTYVLNLLTKTSVEIGYPLGLKTPALPQGWSMEGNRILLSGGGTNKVYTVNTDGKDVQEFDVPVAEGSYPVGVSYSPDGKQIAYTEDSNFSGDFHLVIYTPFIYDLNTKASTRIGDGSVDCYAPQWSSTGKQILVNCNLSTDGVTVIPRVRLFDISTNNDTILAKESADLPCVRPAWSPDGNQFAAYCRMNDDPRALFIFNSDGSKAKEFPIGDTAVWEMTWSPDGQQMLYVAGEDQNSSSIYVVNADGSNNHTITTQTANYSELSVFSIP